jgi:hypothetical protein
LTTQRNRSLLRAALVLLALAMVLGFAACSQDEGSSEGKSERAAPAHRQQATKRDPGGARPADPPVRMEVAGGARLDRSKQAELADAARRFAVTLVSWLYGDRREIDVEPISRQLSRGLANAPPYIPQDQLDSEDGHAVAVQVSVQTSRSGALVVTVRDSRTSYPIPASFELRAGHWQVVHLNTH